MSHFTENGFHLDPLGGGRNLIKPEVGMEVVRALNALGCMEIQIAATGKARVIYSDGKVIFLIPVSALVGGGSITVTEEDDSPTVAGVTEIRFPNGRVTDNGGGSVSVSVSSGGMNYRGQWDDEATYFENDVVVILTGTGAGTYIAVANTTEDPTTGSDWVQLAPGDAFGRWA